MFKYTKYTLKKIEDLFSELKYTIRYEKGNFQSGYCIVENRQIAVINKFFDTEARINCLLEILGTIELPEEQVLTDKTADFYKKLKKFLDKLEKEGKEEIAVEAVAVEEESEVKST